MDSAYRKMYKKVRIPYMTYFSLTRTFSFHIVTDVYTHSKKLLQVITSSFDEQAWMLSSNPIRILIRNNRISYPQFTTSVYLVLLNVDIDCSIHNTKLDNCTRWSRKWWSVGVVQRLLVKAGRDKWQWINGNF